MLYIREKKNRSGTKSVVIFDKSNGYRELHTVGVSSDPQEIKELRLKAQEWIDEHVGQLGLDFDQRADIQGARTAQQPGRHWDECR